MLVIGIAGGTGSGKTTVVKKITEQFPKKKLLFYRTTLIMLIMLI